MGNCLGIFWTTGRLRFPFFRENGISTSTKGLHSSLSSSPNQPPCEVMQASTSRPSKELGPEERSAMISNLEIVLKTIDSALYSHRYQNSTPSNRDHGIPDFLDRECKDAEKELEKKLKEKTAVMVDVMDFAPDAWNGLQSLLGEIASFHWVFIAFSVVASVLTRVEDMGENKRICLSVLDDLHRLGNRLVELFHDEVILTEEHYKKSVQVIVGGAVLCIAHLNSTLGRRYLKVNATKGSIEKLGGKIQSVYAELNRLVMRSAVVKPMKSYKAEFPEHAVGLEQTIPEIRRIMEAATQEAGEEKTPAILLHGIGGIGKTTLGEALCARISMDCAEYTVAKIELGDKPSSTHISECQKHILEIFCRQRQNIENPSKGRDLLKVNLKKCSSPILLFIDNVSRRKDLDEFLPRTLFLPQNSYILVTSRYNGVSRGLSGCVLWKTYDVGGLKKPEAETFLKTLLGGLPSDMKEKFNAVIELCDGWPLALDTIGSFLGSINDQDKSHAWDSVITRLRECDGVDGHSNSAMIEVLKWTYDQIDRKCQDVFLDICYLSRNADWDWVKTLGHTRFEWKTLESFSLVKKKEVEYGFRRSQYDSTSFLHWHNSDDTSPRAAVHVHDLFVALGEQESQKRSGGRFHDLREKDLPTILQAQHNEDAFEVVEVLVLDIYMRLSAENLDAIHKRLRILHLGKNVYVDGVCGTIPSNLRICSMFGFPYRDLSGLQDLRVLHIDGGGGYRAVRLQFEQLKLPKRLEILHLSKIDGLRHFNVDAFEGCDDLHTVRIRKCQNLSELPASICSCQKIRVLFLQMNVNLSSLPQDFNRLQSLERFYFDAWKPCELPTGFASLKKLQEVFVAEIGGMREDLDFSQMPLLEFIHLGYVPSERSISHDLSQPPPQAHRHHGFGKLLSLRALRIGHCDMNQVLIDDISQLRALKELDLEGCKSFQRLPDALSRLSSLEDLNLAKCTSLTELPGEFGSLHALKFLTLRGCKNLQLLPDSFSGLETLQALVLRGCETLKELPRGFEKLHVITIDLAQCSSLQKLPENFGDLAMLKKVDLCDCRSLKMLPESWGNLEELTRLVLSHCTNLEALPEGMTRLKRLESLYLDGCRREVQCSQVLAELSPQVLRRDEE